MTSKHKYKHSPDIAMQQQPQAGSRETQGMHNIMHKLWWSRLAPVCKGMPQLV